MKVRDFMITKVITVKPSCTIKQLLQVLTTNRIGGVPVVDDKDHLVGMISDGDVLRFLSPKTYGVTGLVSILIEEDFEDVLEEKLDTTVSEIMTKRNISYVTADEDFERTIRIISQHHYKKIPVINGVGRVIGVLSRGDIINTISKKILSA